MIVRAWYTYRISPARPNTSAVVHVSDVLEGAERLPVFVSRNEAKATAALAAVHACYGPSFVVYAYLWRVTLAQAIEDSPALLRAAKVRDGKVPPASWATPEGRRVLSLSRAYVRGPWKVKP